MRPFVYTALPTRILFGRGSVQNLAEEIDRAGGRRALVLSTPFQEADARALAARLGDRAAGVFPRAAMHTPVEVTKEAMAAFDAAGADCVLAYGGGSTIGLGKAIAHRNGATQIVVPTTYAGSEVTPILGQTEDGVKTTIRGAEILPEVVVYDPDLTLGLPVTMSVTSGLNAMAHAVEALYAADRNPVAALMAVEGLRALKDALPLVVAAPDDPEARSEALYGAWLCGSVLGAVGMALHHKLCHTLGGSFDLPHAETHAILLPHTAAYNATAARDELAPAAALFDGDIGGGLFDFAVRLGAPTKLAELGLTEADLDRAAELSTRQPYPNPREVTRDGVRALLDRALTGARPAA